MGHPAPGSYKIFLCLKPSLYKFVNSSQHSAFALALFFVGVAAPWITPSSGPFAHKAADGEQIIPCLDELFPMLDHNRLYVHLQT